MTRIKQVWAWDIHNKNIEEAQQEDVRVAKTEFV
jgi:hypothetical protein